MTALLQDPPDFFVYAMAIIVILFALIALARAALALARDCRRFGNGD